jgi:hypothetical protein
VPAQEKIERNGAILPLSNNKTGDFEVASDEDGTVLKT